MNFIRFWLALLVLSATLCQCRKTKAITPEDYLPPETQFGAGTFACRINGKVWTYKDHNGGLFDLRPITQWHIEPLIDGGTLTINGIRYINNQSIDLLSLKADSVFFKNDILVNANQEHLSISYTNNQPIVGTCDFYSTRVTIDSSKNFFRAGLLHLTKLDTLNRIIAGRFECVIFQKNYNIICDTLKITDGRFDLKF